VLMDESVTFTMAFLAGVLSFLSPCVLPVVPGYLAFITGMSRDELEQTASRRQILIAAAFFVSGFSLVFLAMGASASLLGQLVLQYRDWIARVGGVLIIMFGLHMVGLFRLGLLMRERRILYSGRPATKLGAGVAGIVFAAGWTPCIGPVLGSLWTLAGVRGTMWGAMLLLGGYSLGLALPFILAAAATGAFFESSRRISKFLPALERASGAVLILIGVLLLTGSFAVLAAQLTRYTPNFILERL
jgi:cytochrome c-type biogenesis protein